MTGHALGLPKPESTRLYSVQLAYYTPLTMHQTQQQGRGFEESSRGFWIVLWEEDLRGPSRDVIRQTFFFACTALLQLSRRIVEASGIASWLGRLIGTGTDGLTVIAFVVLSLVIAIGMLRSGWASVRKL